MKKGIIGIFLVVIIVILCFITWYRKSLQTLNDIKNFNSEYESYLKKEITGVDLTTVLNMAIENNNQYEIPKNSDGTYQNDGRNSIEILVRPMENRKVLSNGSF